MIKNKFNTPAYNASQNQLQFPGHCEFELDQHTSQSLSMDYALTQSQVWRTDEWGA